VTTFYPPHTFGGDGVQVQRLAQALSRRGHEVSVVYAPGAFSLLGPKEADDHVDIGSASREGVEVAVHALDRAGGKLEALLVQQTGRPVLFRGEIERLLEASGGRAPDVIHYHNVSLVGGLGVLRMGSAVKLYTPHEYWLVCPTHLLFRYNREICRERTCIRCTLRAGRPPQVWRSRRLLDRSIAEIDSFIFPSRLTESVHRQHGIERPGHVMPHFLPDEYFEAARRRGARQDDIEPFFLYVGRMDAVKGVDRLARHFAESSCPAPLWLVGDGPLEGMLRSRYGDSASIRFMGRLAQEELGDLYRDALAVILPSAGYEVLGLVVLEAFAHGTPAVVTAVGGAKELIEASGAGFVYESSAELDRALTVLANDAAIRADLGRAARVYVGEAHTEAGYVRRYEQLVQELRK
jgi:glycosyltransferase involved in cell wall biosynthesis